MTREAYQDIVEWAESSRAKEIDDKIEEWHTGDSKQTLAEYLGMTPEQYAAYVENGLTTKRVTPAVVEGQNVEQQAEEENV